MRVNEARHQTPPVSRNDWTLAFAPSVIGLSDICSMVLPLINTLEGADSAGTRTVEDADVLKKRYPFRDWNAGRLAGHFYVVVLPQAHLAKPD